MKVNIDIPEDMIQAIDGVAKKEFFSRSEWIRSAIRAKLMRVEAVYPEGIPEIPKAPVITEEMINKAEKMIGDAVVGFCEIHFEKGVKYLLKLITWEDENGTAVVDKKYACPKCVL